MLVVVLAVVLLMPQFLVELAVEEMLAPEQLLLELQTLAVAVVVDITPAMLLVVLAVPALSSSRSTNKEK